LQTASAVPAVAWDGARLRVLDQTLLPWEERVLELDGPAEVADAIRRLAVRGAPLIGVAAGYGLAMAAARTPDGVDEAAKLLRGARPTAVNLGWAVDRVEAAFARGGADAARAEAEAIQTEDEAASAAMAAHGADLLAGASRLMTHCNTGALAAMGRGTALGVIAELAGRGPVHVLAGETRPLLQGARLTVYELRRLGIAHELVVDGAGPGLIRRGEVDAVVVGVDRAAANGDVANKVGTYPLALAARAAGIPFVVAGPTSSIDPATASGEDIIVEERDAGEVLRAGGAALAPEDTPCRNPAFDVTPAELITARVTERGVARPPSRETVAALRQ
jgi:S-methyl-5-thioribose-1-phosphate isomerase